MSMVFLNAFTNEVESEAKRPPNMTPEVLASRASTKNTSARA